MPLTLRSKRIDTLQNLQLQVCIDLGRFKLGSYLGEVLVLTSLRIQTIVLKQTVPLQSETSGKVCMKC
jgi:hypothetical protein